ncbi:MAG: hypothetical protein QOI40_2148 [Alphaproteobacteria bacterium]|jgi:hypothetical protein|nr:hypothetical protein [Alphaproteobacteria bacterium]
MHFIKSSALALTLCAATALSASASERDSQASCIAAGAQVKTALDGAQNTDAAREKRMGLEFCNAGLYSKGMAHYARAMEIVGGKLAQN